MKHHKSASALAAAFFFLLTVSCSGGVYNAESAPMDAFASDMRFAAGENEKQIADSNVRQQAGLQAGVIEESRDQVQRKRIMSGYLWLQVDDIPIAQEALAAQVKAFGGYVSSSQLGVANASMELKVPAERFDEMMTQGSGAGKVLQKNTNEEDVTDRYFDLENRIRTKRILLERYLSYLSQAKNVEDLLAIEKSSNELTFEIEQLEGSMKGLQISIDYATLSVYMTLPGSQSSSGDDFADQIADFGNTMGQFFQVLVIALLYIIVVGTVLVLVGAAFWLVGFGRIGLVRKLYVRVSRQGVPNSGEPKDKKTKRKSSGTDASEKSEGS